MAAVHEVRAGEACPELAGSVCAIGVFDGVHRGHRFIVGEALKEAAALEAPSAIITFSVDPDDLFAKDALRKLMSDGERLAELADSGVDDMAVLRFDAAMAALSPQGFLDRLFADGAPASIHVGSDFRFGAHASGTAKDLAAWAAAHDAAFHAHDLVEASGEPISSTRIRACLAAGDVEGAAELLGRPYRFCGPVLHGREAGREMGIRTANLRLPDDLRVLQDGVYAAYAHVGGERYKAAVSVGIPPTFAGEAESNMEAHLLGFDGDLYGEDICLDFMHRLRDMERFDDVDELIATINRDIAWVRQNL